MPIATAIERRRGLAVWIATTGGVGYLPVPGTFGSLVGIALVAALGRLPFGRPSLALALLAATVLVYFAGIGAASLAEDYFGRTDPGHVVIDEVAGQMLSFLLCPDASWRWLLAGFLLFRFFDVLKPFPAGRAEHLRAGWGIMTDDMVAGIYTLAALAAFRFVLK